MMFVPCNMKSHPAVCKVSLETVLTDATGLHLGAGPYMLIYSRACEVTPEKYPWPTELKVSIKVGLS